MATTCTSVDVFLPVDNVTYKSVAVRTCWTSFLLDHSFERARVIALLGVRVCIM